MSGYKTVVQESSIADAVSNAFSALEELASECREIVDNASEGLAQTQRIQTLDSTASQLEGLSEPEMPDKFGEIRVKYFEATKRRGVSRTIRCSNAINALQAVVEVCDERLEELGEDADAAGPIETLRETCQDAIDEAEGCEFPGMYG
jgi:hypothetical protein